MAKNIGELAVLLTADTSRFKRGMKGSARAAKSFEFSVTKSINAVGNSFIGLAALVAAKKIFGALMQDVDELDKLGKTARLLGFTTEELSQMQFAAKQTGVEIETFNMASQRMVRRIAEAAAGTGEAAAALDELGLDAQRLKQAGPAAAFREIADAIQKVENPADKVRLAMRLFDSEGVKLVNTLELGSEGLDAMAARSDELGNTIGGHLTDSAEGFNDSVEELMLAVKGVVHWTVQHVLPLAEKIVSKLTDIVVWFNQLDDGLLKNTIKVAALMGGFTAGIVVMGKVIALVLMIVKALKSMAVAQTIVLALSGPSGWIRIAAGIGVALGSLYLLESAFGESAESAKEFAEGNEHLEKSVADATGKIEDQKAAVEENEAAMQKMKSRADSIFMQTRTEDERRESKIKELNELLDEGLITQETYSRAMDQYNQRVSASVSLVRDLGRAWEESHSRASEIIDSLQTDGQKMKKEIEEINDLVAGGFLQEEVGAEAIRRVQERFNNRNADTQSTRDMASGNRVNFAAMGAMTAIGQERNKAQQTRKRTLEELQQQTRALAEILEVGFNSQGAAVQVSF